MNCTWPVGGPGNGVVPVTVAVKVTGSTWNEIELLWVRLTVAWASPIANACTSSFGVSNEISAEPVRRERGVRGGVERDRDVRARPPRPATVDVADHAAAHVGRPRRDAAVGRRARR